MTSGRRKAPPISTSSPRDTTTSRPLASAAMVSITAAALLLTTVAASAPVISQISDSTKSSRSPRPPVSRSYSRLPGLPIVCSRRSIAAWGNSERPRLVWMTVPVRLTTGRKLARARVSHSTRSSASGCCHSDSSADVEASAALRITAITRRALSVTKLRPLSAISCCPTGVSSNLSTDGRSRRSIVGRQRFKPSLPLPPAAPGQRRTHRRISSVVTWPMVADATLC